MGFANWKFLLDIYNQAPKGDGMRPPAVFEKYVDKVAAMNAASARNVKGADFARIAKTTQQPEAYNPSTTLPGN